MPRAPRLPAALLLSLAPLLTSLPACGGDQTQTTESSFSGAPSSTEPPATAESSTGAPTTTSDSDTTTTTSDDTTTTADDTTTSTTTTETGDDTSTGAPIDMCAALGGMDPAAGIPALVDDFFQRVLVDDRVNGYFLNSDIDGPALSTCMSAQLGALAECPDVHYDCLDMKTAHQGLGISDLDHADFVELLGDALHAFKATHPDLSDAAVSEFTATVFALGPDIVEDPAHDATLYQRVGRKPQLRKLVGDPDKSGTFLRIVDDDDAINGFFLATDYARLATCMVRQLGAIDGPIVYGAEVSAPGDVEPGVALANPCKDMMSAHVGLKDDLLTPITIDDFMAVLADMNEALENFDVVQADREQLLATLTDLCPQIVVESNTCPGNHVTVVAEAKDLGLSLVPVDGKYNGTLGSMACVDLDVPADGLDFVADLRLTVAMDHTWLGDVTIKLVGPDAKILTVLSRVGDPNGALPDSSEGCCGDDSNFSASAPFTFNDSAPFPGADIGKGPKMTNNNVVCADEMPKHVPCDWTVYPGNGPGTAFSDYLGKPAVGTWSVCFGDSGMGDTGAVSSVSLALDKVKDPP